MRGLRLIVTAMAALVLEAGAQEPSSRFQVVTPKDDGVIATGINGRGDLVGFEWVEMKTHPGVLEQGAIFARGKAITYLPKLEGYTATFPAAVSDDGVVVGRASKPAPPGVIVRLRNQAFVWDAEHGMHGLGTLPDDMASIASGISRDGRRISGYSVGEDRVRACYWDRENGTWKPSALPQQSKLGSTVVPISDDGKRMAGVDGLVPCLWTQNKAERWTREVIGEPSSLFPRSVNNEGTVVGLRYTSEGATRAVLRSRGEVPKDLDLPAGYFKSEASGINNNGVVVGLIDGPNGSKIGPNAFVFHEGRLRVLQEGGPNFTAATAINDRGQVAGVFEKDEENVPANAGDREKRDDR